MTATPAGQMATGVAHAAAPSARRLLTVLLRRYGVPVAEAVTADSADSAVEASWWLGFPVTLVAEGAGLTGRPETARCGLATPAQVRLAYRQLAASIGPAMTGVRLRRQPQHGAEVIVRVARGTGTCHGDAGGADSEDEGVQVSLALAGPAAALVSARVTRQAPITVRDARSMLAELRGGPVAAEVAIAALPGADLASASGEVSALDLAALADLLVRVGRLAVSVPQLAELELNPVVVTGCGAAVAGVHGRFGDSRESRAKPKILRSAS